MLSFRSDSDSAP